MPAKKTDANAWDAVYAVVRRIPRGRVMNYGQIAELVRPRLSARAVGWAMHDCPKNVPWQRVVNAAGRCSADDLPDSPPGLQRALLEQEGIEFRENGSLDIERYRWVPRKVAPRRARKVPAAPARKRRPATRT